MIVVTGAAGQVGTVLVKALRKQNEQVKAIVTPDDDLTSIESKQITIVEGDIRDREFLVREFQGAKKVFRLAGIVSITPGQQALLESVNVQGRKTSSKHVAKRILVDLFIRALSMHWLSYHSAN